MDTLYNIKQTAFILKVHPLTVRRYIKEGKLKAVKIAGNVRIKESDLQQFNSSEITPKPTSIFVMKHKRKPVKIFNEDDPLLRLQGRIASLTLTSQ